MNKVLTGSEVILSEQQVVDCDTQDNVAMVASPIPPTSIPQAKTSTLLIRTFLLLGRVAKRAVVRLALHLVYQSLGTSLFQVRALEAKAMMLWPRH